MNNPRAKLARRRFLLAVAAGASGAAAIAKRQSPQNVPETPAKEESGRGYQLSAHVLKYYRTAQV